MRSHRIASNRAAVIDYVASPQSSTITFHTPTSRHVDTFLRRKCAADILALGVMPNTKEITESMACYVAARKHLGLHLSDPTVTAIVVGDGNTPRTAAIFAYMSAWTVYSIDPRLVHKERYKGVKRLHVVAKKIEDTAVHCDGPAVVVLPHAHVSVIKTLQSVIAPVRHVVALPCCVELQHPATLHVEYTDWGVWSPERLIRVWRDV